MTEHAPVPGTPQWEALCRQCGQCCYEKLEYRGEVFLTSTPCPFLDATTRLCSVYPERSTCQQGCVHLTPEVIALGVLPAGCPYRRIVPDAPVPRPYHELPEEIRAQLESDE